MSKTRTSNGLNLMALPERILFNFIQHYPNDRVLHDLGPVCRAFFRIACEVSSKAVNQTNEGTNHCLLTSDLVVTNTKNMFTRIQRLSEDTNKEKKGHKWEIENFSYFFKVREISDEITDIVCVDRYSRLIVKQNVLHYEHLKPLLRASTYGALYFPLIKLDYDYKDGIKILFETRLRQKDRIILEQIVNAAPNLNAFMCFHDSIHFKKSKLSKAMGSLSNRRHKLEYMHLQLPFDNQENSDWTEYIKQTTNLKFLTLTRGELNESELTSLLTGCENLLSLELVETLNAQRFIGATKCTFGLEHLSFQKCNLDDSMLKYVVKSCNRSRELSISDCAITKSGLESNLNTCETLKMVSVFRKAISKEDVEDLALQYPNVQIIWLN